MEKIQRAINLVSHISNQEAETEGCLTDKSSSTDAPWSVRDLVSKDKLEELERAQWLRVCLVLADGPSLAVNTYDRRLTNTHSSISK